MTNPSVDILIQQAQLAEREGRGDDARALYERALYSLKRAKDGKLASSLLRWVGRAFHLDGDETAALDCLEAALAVAQLTGEAAEIGHAINNQAVVYHQLGDLDAAEALYLEARGHAIDASETRLTAMTAQNLGVISAVRGDLEKTLRYYRASLAEFRTLGAPKEVLLALNNMGMLCTDLERWDDAARAFEEAVEIAEALGDVPARILLEVNRADLEIARGDFTAAGACCELAQTLSAQTQDGFARGEIEKNLGTVKRELGDPQAAEEHLERAQAIAVEKRDLLLSAETAREHAELCRRQGRHRDALMHLNRGHRLFTQLRAKRDLADIERRNARLEKHFLDSVRHWSGTIEAKDRYTQGHCERVADLACALALRTGIEPRALFWFRIGAIVHDVGKLIIPSEILNKPGKLAPDEWELIKRHPVAGVEMLADMDFPGDVIPMVRSHHERWDGQGYPDGLVGDAIPEAARMLCIADVYDALTSKRSYKGTLSHDAAMEIMRADVGKQFDPRLFELFEDLMKTRTPSIRQRAVVESAPAVPRAAERELKVAGPSDDLTGLLTRRPFVDAANRVLADRGPFATVSLIVIDVDHFKHVNDTHGHLQGDAVLRVVAGTLREVAAGMGIVGRYAGDEFVVLLPHTPIDEARDLAERLRATVARTAVPLRERSGSTTVSLSVGVASARPDTKDFEALFELTDRALYEAKRRGRNTVVAANEIDEAAAEPEIDLKQFVGRGDELGRLARLLEGSIGGGVNVAAVVGEAGVGKSTLVRRLSGEVRLRAGALVAGRCSEADAKPPYAPWAEAISAIEQLGIMPSRDWKALAHVVPALRNERTTLEQAADKYALFDEIVSYLAVATAVAPLVIVLDDMQWADAMTWDVLEHVLHQLHHERLLVCMTLRAEELRGPVLERRNRLVRDERFHELLIARLDASELQEWLHGVFSGDAAPDLVDFIQRYSEGNPLLATQLVRVLVDEGAVRYEAGRWMLRADPTREAPPAVSGLFERRLDRLSPDSRRVLNTAAVIGREFDVDLAIAAGAGTEDEILDVLDEAIAEAVVEPVSSSATNSRFSFTHSLLVEAIRREINPRRLARIHERVAAAMEASGQSNAAEIAIHYERAGNAAKAYSHAMEAGRASLAVYAHAEARRFFEIAERAALDPAQRAAALHQLAEVAETEGRYALTEELCDRALAGLAASPDSHAVLGLKRMRQRVRALQGQPATETIAACRELLDLARELRDHGEQAALLIMISLYSGRLGEWRDAERMAREAVEAAEIAGDGRLLAEALTRLGMSMMDRRSSESADFYHRALSLFRGVGDRCGEARCYINIGIIHQRAGDTAASEAAYDRGLEAAKSAHATDLAGLASLNLGVLYLRRGQRDLASERFEEALHAFTLSANEGHRLVTLYNMAHLARESEDWSTATSLYDQVVAIAGRIGQPDVELGARAGQALASLAVGSRSLADEAMRWIRANVEPRPDWWFQGRDMVDALRIRLAAERGDDAHALRLLHEAVEIAEQHDPYTAAYLVAECAPSLMRCGESLVALLDAVQPEVEALGFVGIAERMSTLRIALAGASQAA
ncbi:MAG TPA: tetratricopeptide repeat protein [Gemmatimonadaceae bacterium]|nr:tetratricopeptide repeat protein [Gemmatimonadaceae bacterium]